MLYFYLITFKLNCSKCLIRIKIVSVYLSRVREHLHSRVRHMKRLVQKRKQLGRFVHSTQLLSPGLLEQRKEVKNFNTVKRQRNVHQEMT